MMLTIKVFTEEKDKKRKRGEGVEKGREGEKRRERRDK